MRRCYLFGPGHQRSLGWSSREMEKPVHAPLPEEDQIAALLLLFSDLLHLIEDSTCSPLALPSLTHSLARISRFRLYLSIHPVIRFFFFFFLRCFSFAAQG